MLYLPSDDQPHFPLKIHTLRWFLLTCTTQLLSRLLDVLRSALPRFPDAPALTALLSLLTYCTTSYAFDFRTLLLPLFESRCAHTCLVSPQGGLEEFVRTQETGWAAVRAPRGRGRQLVCSIRTHRCWSSMSLLLHCSTCQCAHRSNILVMDATSAGGYAERPCERAGCLPV